MQRTKKVNLDDERGKIYTHKGLVLIEKPINKLHKGYYFTTIHITAVNLAHVKMIGKVDVDQQEKGQ